MFGDLIDLSSPLPQVNANLTQSFETPTLEPQVFRKSAQFPVASLLDDDVSTISRDQPIEPEPMEDVQHSMPTSMQTAGDMGLQEQSASNVKETLQAPYMMEEEQTQEGSLARPALQPATEDQPQLQMSVVGADNTSLLTAGERRELLELRAMLSKVEASRDAVARDLGLSKGVIAGLEGKVHSFERQVKQLHEENTALKARLAAVDRDLREAKHAASVTPERCRTSARALMCEAQKAQGVAAAREAQVRKLQEVVKLESEEVRSLNEFLVQERAALMSEVDAMRADLAAAQERCSAAELQVSEAQGRVSQLEGELNDARREIWAAKNQGIEQGAELQAVTELANTAQAAAQAAQAQAAEAQAAAATAMSEMAERSAAGIRLFKQVRAVAHALDRQLHHLQKMPDVTLSVRQLQDWCAKQAPYWSDVASRLESGDGAGSAAAAAAAPSAAGAGGVRASQLLALGAEDMTASLSAMVGMGAGAGMGGGGN